MSDLPDGTALLQKIWDTLGELDGLARAQAVAENAYKVSFAEAYEKAEGTVKDKEARAVQLVSKQWLAAENAINSSRIAERSLDPLKAMLSYYQTLSKNEREVAERLARR